MKSFFATVLILICLGLSCPEAQARTVLGLAPDAIQVNVDGSRLSELQSALSAELGDQVSIRTFDDEETLRNWMVRFNEVDIAFLSQAFADKQPAGSFSHLKTLKRAKSSLPTLVLVARQGLSAERLDRLDDRLVGLSRNPVLRTRLGLPGATKPKATKPKATKPKATKPKATKPKATKPASREIAEPVATHPVLQTTVPEPERPEVKSQRPVERQAPDLPAKQDPPETVQAEESLPSAQPLTRPDDNAALAERARKPDPKAEVAATPPLTQAEKPAAPADPGKARIYLFVALLLLAAIIIKVWLLVWHRRHKKKPLSAPATVPSADSFDYQLPTQELLEAVEERVTEISADTLQEESLDLAPTIPEPPVNTPSELEPDLCTADCDLPADENTIIESGELSGGQVPALLKRCADLPEPAILEVRKGSYTKRVYFAAGQIAHASPWCAPGSSNNRKWKKLSYLLIRDGLISETERDRALEMVERQPGLHLGEALLKLGFIDLEGLRQALNRQTKLKVFSLILFPEGAYRVLADDRSLPAEENISLEVTALIRDASHHKAEWTAIRKTLPGLDTRLAYLPDGQDKLEQVRLSVHQQLILSQIDGQQSIGELCAESTMMDYEVYRFLYLMVKAGVLACN